MRHLKHDRMGLAASAPWDIRVADAIKAARGVEDIVLMKRIATVDRFQVVYLQLLGLDVLQKFRYQLLTS